MRKYGDKKHGRGKVEGHQDCSACQPEVKNGRKKARRDGKRQAKEEK